MRFIFCGYILAALRHATPVRFVRSTKYSRAFGFEPTWTRAGGYGSFPYFIKAPVQTIFSTNYCLPGIVFLYIPYILT
jgi:hypothetical protein